MAKKNKRIDNINVLDTNYQIYYRTIDEDPYLEGLLGYCDKYSKIIVIDDSDLDDVKEMDSIGGNQWRESYKELQKKVLRHELTHAFITECGLSESTPNQWANNEEMVDFLAINAHKLVKLYEKAGAL